MAKISTSKLNPGMIISQDVKDQQGRLLATSGQEITSKLIRIFKIWGIGETRIKNVSEQEQEAGQDSFISRDILEKAEEITRYRFQYNDLNDPFVFEIFRISCLKKAHRLWEKPETNSFDSYLEPDRVLLQNKAKAKPKTINPDRLIAKTLHLGTIPDIYYKTIAAINNPEASLDDIAGIVSKDVTLTAKVLQLVNSSFYSLKQRVDTLTWALALIGTNQLMTIVSGVSAVSLFKNIPSELLNVVSFWEHSIACGTAARLLSSYQSGQIDAERFFVAGLLHDIGRLILIQNLPRQYLGLLQQVRKEEIFLFTAETNTFGLDHSQIGAHLAGHWNLPESLGKMIKHHHFPGLDSSLQETSIINLADVIVNALEIGNSGEYFVPIIEPHIFEELKLDKEILQPLINEIENQLEDIFEIIYGTPE
ncbi:MAG: HDOD domain-containing protein [Desulfohalobiaceae bacterium]|nr:HDOD domain-containing protein [Desulfohalobiaceae bacterium]